MLHAKVLIPHPSKGFSRHEEKGKSWSSSMLHSPTGCGGRRLPLFANREWRLRSALNNNEESDVNRPKAFSIVVLGSIISNF